ncbi:MAG: ATP-binding protein [Rikenellaceae bacterium]
MFKSIQYKLIHFIALLIISVTAATYFFLNGKVWYGCLSVLIILFSLKGLYNHYRKFNQNILFLLNALDNGDYSFHFTEAKLSKREKELNQMLNRIKEILTKARKEVIENENFLSLIIESISTGIIILDEKNNVKSVNQAAVQLLGLHVFTHIKQLSTIDETFPELFEKLQPGSNTQIKISNEREERQISLQLSKIVLKRGLMKVIALNNIGNELEAKEMESWIRLIRVMTHEIMNSIAPITSLSETLLFSHKQANADNSLNKNTIEALETINVTAKGLISFVDSYRKFTGIPKPQFINFELIPLVEKVIHLESGQIKSKCIEIQLICDSPVTLNADYTQIKQVLINLIKNAIEAIEPFNQGKIKIKISAKDNKPQIDICNNGKPIPKNIEPNIFIPFFTTKDSGTGIGLSMSRYIMRLHGGNLKHHTSEEGTVFSMAF